VRASDMTETLDLTPDYAFSIDLLNDSTAWRQRVSQEFVFAGQTSDVHVATTHEVLLPSELVAARNPTGLATGRFLLPMGTRPKRLLLRVRLEGPADPSRLVSRTEGAALQAAYLYTLLGGCPSNDSIRAGLIHGRPAALSQEKDVVWIVRLFAAICRATPQQAEEYLATERLGSDEERLATFLNERAEMSDEVRPEDIRRWMEACRPHASGSADCHRNMSTTTSAARRRTCCSWCLSSG
jgi:hypothetical protein